MVEEVEGSVREARAAAAAAVGVVDSALAEIQREVGAERKRTLGKDRIEKYRESHREDAPAVV